MLEKRKDNIIEEKLKTPKRSNENLIDQDLVETIKKKVKLTENENNELFVFKDKQEKRKIVEKEPSLKKVIKLAAKEKNTFSHYRSVVSSIAEYIQNYNSDRISKKYEKISKDLLLEERDSILSQYEELSREYKKIKAMNKQNILGLILVYDALWTLTANDDKKTQVIEYGDYSLLIEEKYKNHEFEEKQPVKPEELNNDYSLLQEEIEELNNDYSLLQENIQGK